MSVFKAVGKVLRVAEGGRVSETFVKLFFRAEDENEARALATEVGIVEARVTFYCENHSVDLGSIRAYNTDNNCGVAPGW